MAFPVPFVRRRIDLCILRGDSCPVGPSREDSGGTPQQITLGSPFFLLTVDPSATRSEQRQQPLFFPLTGQRIVGATERGWCGSTYDDTADQAAGRYFLTISSDDAVRRGGSNDRQAVRDRSGYHK